MAEVLDPKQMVTEAQAAYEQGDFIKAAQLFRFVQEGYESVGDQLNAAEMANNQSVALLRAGEAEVALEVLAGKGEVFAEAGDIRRQAMTLGNRAAAQEALKKWEDARINYRQASDLFVQIGEGENYTATMQALSALELRTQHPMDAMVTMQAALNKSPRPDLKQRLLKKLLKIPFRLLNRS
jgi:tetratricopeptide (TPR) repeat protein